MDGRNCKFWMFTLPETNSSHLKMDGWNTSFLFGWPIFRGYVSFKECRSSIPIMTWTSTHWFPSCCSQSLPCIHYKRNALKENAKRNSLLLENTRYLRAEYYTYLLNIRHVVYRVDSSTNHDSKMENFKSVRCHDVFFL